MREEDQKAMMMVLEDEGGGGGQPVYLDDNCEVRTPPLFPPFILSIYKLILTLP